MIKITMISLWNLYWGSCKLHRKIDEKVVHSKNYDLEIHRAKYCLENSVVSN